MRSRFLSVPLCLVVLFVSLIAGAPAGHAQSAAPAGPGRPTAAPPVPRPSGPDSRQAGGGIVPPPSPAPGGQPVTVSGVLGVVYGDQDNLYIVTDPNDAAVRTAVYLDEQVAAAGGGIVRLQRKRVTVTGVPASVTYDGAPTIIASSVRLAPLQSLATASTTGSQAFAVLLCQFPDQATVQREPSWYTGLMGDTAGSLNHYFQDVSYGQINLNGSAVGSAWRTLPNPMSYYGNGTNTLANLKLHQLGQDCVNLFAGEINFNGFVGVQIVTNGAVFATAWGGTDTLTLSGVTRTVGVTWFNRVYSEYAAVWQHEMGHAFGLSHSGSDTGVEYMDAYDVMGYSYYTAPAGQPYVYWAQHTIANYKAQLGWIPPARIFTYTGGTQTITVDKLGSSDTSNYLYAKLSIAGSSTRYYTLEARKKTGSYENQLPIGSSGAVIIHEVNETRGVPAYVQGSPSGGAGNFTAAAGYQWTVGRTFAAAAANLLITVDAATTNGFTVTIAPNTTGCNVDQYEPNDPPATRTPLTINTNYSGLICPTGDEDYYQFSAQANVAHTVTLTNLAANIDLYLLGAGDSIVASSTNTGTTSETLTYTPASAGTLSVRVQGASGAFHATQPYTLRVATPTTSSVTTESVWTSDGGSDFSVQKTSYLTGDPIRYVARVVNTSGAAQSVRFVWNVSGPAGTILTNVNDPISTPNGTAQWGLNTSVPAPGRPAGPLTPVLPTGTMAAAPTIPLSAPAGTYTFTFSVTHNGQTSTRSANFTVLSALDTNRDGQVTIDDSLCIARSVAGLTSDACPSPLNGPDVNADGNVTAVDALCLARYVAGLARTSACPLDPPAPARASTPPPGAPQGSATAAGTATVRLDPAALTLPTGGQGTVNVRASGDARAGARIGGWTIDLVYDPAAVKVVTCTSSLGICNAGYAPGIIRIAGASLSGLDPDTILATVQVQALGAARTSSPIRLTVARLITPAGVTLNSRTGDGTVAVGR